MNFPKLLLPQNCNGNFYRKFNPVIKVILVLCQLFILKSDAYYLDNNPYRHKQILGPKASFVVEWSVNWKDRSILFQVSAETKGWVGFGLSKDGRMVYSDAIIGGVDSFSGKPYFNDVHIAGNRSVLIDQQNDWKLIGAWEKGKRTYLSFTRAFDTCDSQDYPITKDLVVMIWAYGETDNIQYHQTRRGSAPVYLLDPSISEEIAHHHYRQIGPHSNLYLVQRWALSNKLRLSSKPTSVWCSVERGPRLLDRHDIVGMGAFLPTSLARQHVQKMMLFKCTSPQQTEALKFFDPYARLKGEECYLNEKRTLPVSFCRELLYVWGRGGKPFYFPEDIGIPIGESQEEYYLLETHFDNPKGKSNIDIEAGIEVIYSHRQKTNTASLLQIGYGPLGTFMIPPQATMNVYGNCGPSCTSTMFPKNGLNVFAAMFHSHTLGRSMRIKHIRGTVELPWILKDDNFDSEFQQMRLLSKQATVLPGDQLTTECTFVSNRNITSFSGFSTHDEACSAFLYISTRIPFFRCTSEMPAEQLLTRYGIRNFTWDTTWQDRYVTDPKQMEGTWLGDVVDDRSLSKKSNHDQLQHDLKYGRHLESCPNIYDMMGNRQNELFRMFTNDWQSSPATPIATRTPYLTSFVSYPQGIKEYQEAPFCQSKSTPGITQNQDEYIKQIAPKLNFPQTMSNYVPIVPSPPPPPVLPPIRFDFSTLFSTGSKMNNFAPVQNNGISVPPSPQSNGVVNKLRQNVRPSQNPSSNGIKVPIPPSNVSPPIRFDFSTLFNTGSKINNIAPAQDTGIPVPPSPQSNAVFDKLIRQYVRPSQNPSSNRIKAPIPSRSPIPSSAPGNLRTNTIVRKRPSGSISNSLPIPPRPPSAPSAPGNLRTSTSVRKRPSGSVGSSLSIPPSPPRPPVALQQFNLNDALYNKNRRPTSRPFGLSIPMVNNKQPDYNDKTIMNFFDQIANIFSSSSAKNTNSQNGVSFQQLYLMNNFDSNLLKKKIA